MDSMGPRPFGGSFCGDLVRVQGQGASQATALWVCVCVFSDSTVFAFGLADYQRALRDRVGAVRPPVSGDQCRNEIRKNSGTSS